MKTLLTGSSKQVILFGHYDDTNGAYVCLYEDVDRTVDDSSKVIGWFANNGKLMGMRLSKYDAKNGVYHSFKEDAMLTQQADGYERIYETSITTPVLGRVTSYEELVELIKNH